jgi:hypothetical protein
MSVWHWRDKNTGSFAAPMRLQRDQALQTCNVFARR